MKKISVFFILLVSLSVSARMVPQMGSYSGGHDSLLFDGADGNMNYSQVSGKDCLIKVIRVNGNVTGKVLKKEIENICGEIDTVISHETRVLKEGDMLFTGQSVKTENDKDFMIAELNNGENMFLGGKRGSLMIQDFCNNPPDIIMPLEAGKLGIDWNPLLPKTITICTGSGCLRIKGSMITLEVVNDGDVPTTVLRVYEGSASFGNNLQDKDYQDDMNKKGADIKKAYEDYQSGKISMEEFIKKSQENQNSMISTEPLIINAGFESRITGTDKPSEPVSFDMNADRWWEVK